jgi:hypothetical protein
MQRDHLKPLDPTADAAMLLRRIGFATLALALPIAALVSRRAAVVLVPVAVSLLLLAAFIEAPGKLVRDLRSVIASRAGLGLVFLAGWILLSLTWTQNATTASEKAGNIILAVVLGMAGSAALPERMRAANLNLVALGAGIAAMFAFGLLGLHLINPRSMAGIFGEAGSITRGLGVLIIVFWPALAWLLSRGRTVSALALAALVALLAVSRVTEGGIVAVASGALTFGLVTANREIGIKVIAALTAGLLLLAPLIPFVLMPFTDVFRMVGLDGLSASLTVWTDIVRAEPVKLITGHGLDTVLRGRSGGFLPAATPVSILFETWYELGLVGAVAGAGSLWFAITGAGRMQGPLAAGGVAAYATAFALTAFGFATLQSWWLMTLAAVALLFTAIVRGQYRTERPKAPQIA